MEYSYADIAHLGTILGIWAHPDDEAWSMAGVMAAACRQGQRVACITATYGDAGETADEARWPKHELRAIRERELDDSLAAVGVSEHYWLGYGDGTLNDVASDSAVRRIADHCLKIRPDTILTFAPDGITGHEDHKTISRWAIAAAEAACPAACVYGAVVMAEKYTEAARAFDSAFNVFFNTDRPHLVPKAELDLFFALPADILPMKLKSMAAHASQTSHMFADPEMREYLERDAASEHFVRLR